MVIAAMKLKDACLLLGRKVITNLDNILKSRDITLPTKVRKVKTMFFPVVMNRCESWIIKKAEHRRIDAFKLWCCRRLFESTLDSKEVKPVNLKEINPECSLEELFLKLQYFGNLITANSLEKALKLGEIEGKRSGQQSMRWLDSITDSVDMNLSEFWEIVEYRRAWFAVVNGVIKSQAQLSD